ncbi:C-type lectin domain family 17, member A-like isoform X2 [Solea solea]|uniref:C-type lectin domain family 17, member A-like isoform X2 n=1 Tax=Solea solea TaxID=90069 RepID=UPI00272B89CB|nr:C-type lectin domain family 17, member A-like isoform X2 [Solea solea]
MAEEISYATVVFKNGVQPPKEKKEDDTVYSTVQVATLASKTPNVEAAAASRYFSLLLVSLVILCVLLVTCIAAIISISMLMVNGVETFSATISNLTLVKQQLMMERNILENQTEKLLRDRDNLNWTLGIILKHDTFPVNEFCPDKQCRPCQDQWIHFQEKCYWFDERAPRWKTWNQSQTFCKDRCADLVVIDSQQEQEFIGLHTKEYYSKNHGYWMGLRKNAEGKWLWVDGRNVTLGYWSEDSGTDSSEPCVSFIPTANITANWRTRQCLMENKFICETDVLTRTSVH